MPHFGVGGGGPGAASALPRTHKHFQIKLSLSRASGGRSGQHHAAQARGAGGGHTHPPPALTHIIFFWGKTGAIPSPRNKTPMQLNGVNVNGFIEPQNLPARLQSSVYTRRTKIKSSREEKYQRNKHGVGRVGGRHTQQQGKAGANPTPENKISV